MGLFTKKEAKKKDMADFSKIPELPELPKLPDFGSEISKEKIPQLPRFPNSALGEKFSQDTIRDAITGGEEDEDFGLDDFADEDLRTMTKPVKEPSKRFTFERELEKHTPKEFKRVSKFVKQNEPIFIRLDKFEESLNTFEKIKEQIGEIEGMLKDIKKVKEEEEKELEFWDKEIQNMKGRIEKIDRDIFYKV